MSLKNRSAFFPFRSRSNPSPPQPLSTTQIFRQETALCLLLLLGGAIFKLFYAIQVPYNISPHDLSNPSDWVTFSRGHLSYIQYLYYYHRLPPDYYWQYYHPPLFHLVGAALFQLFYTPGEAIEPIFELLQIVNCLFASGIAICGYRILIHLGVRGKRLVTLTGLLSFCPVLNWLSVSLNNDCLMTLLQAMTIEQTIVWIKTPRMKIIVNMALLLALAMLTKTSAVLLAPAIGCVFLYEFIRRVHEKKGVPELLGQFAVFALISIPLGTSYVLRNWLLFELPPNYIPDLGGEDSGQYVGCCTLLQRLGLPSLTQLISVRIHRGIPDHYSNIWGQTLLTMALDEGILHLSNVFTKCLGGLLVWSGYIIVFALLLGFIRTLLCRAAAVPVRLFLGMGASVLFISYCLFAFQYPYVCTMNFRYIANVLIFLVAGYGLSNREPSTGFRAFMWGYCLLSSTLYLFCAV